MKAAQFKAYGGPDVIEINDNAPDPKPQKGQILIKVFSAGINPVEAAIRNGYMQQMLPLTLPATVGGDFSGVVEAVGEDVSKFQPGDEVYGVANQFKGGSGAVAELATANEITTGPKPKSIDHAQAASLPLVGASAVQAIEDHIKLQSGQRILIHGGAGGIGTLAIQIAKAHGAYIATTASTSDAEMLKALGADEVIDYKSQDFTTIIKDYDAVYDTVGGEMPNKSLAVLKKGGILVSMAGKADEAQAKEHEVTFVQQMTQATTEQLTKLSQLVDEGKVKPQVHQTFALSEAKEAYTLLETGHPKGKVVIKIQG